MLHQLKSLWKQTMRIKPDSTSHTTGVLQGNSTGHYEKQPGFLQDGRSTSTRSTGVFPEEKDPIHPDMPNLSPP